MIQNLTNLLKKEAKWYSLFGLIRIRRGIPRRIPFYFVICWTAMTILDEIPILPFYWFYELGNPLFGMVVGFLLNYLAAPLPVIFSSLYVEKKYKRKLESHLKIMWNFRRSEKRISGHRAVPEPAVYQFVTPMTYREEPRIVEETVKERSEVHEEETNPGRVTHSAY